MAETYSKEEEGPEPSAEDDEAAYWAATDDEEELVSAIQDRFTEYLDGLEDAGLLDLWRSAHSHFYNLSPGGGHEGSKIIEFGVDGEKLGIRSNQLRSIIRYILSSTTADRPAMQPKAMNATAAAMAQVPTARRALEYFHKIKRQERQLRGVALRALLYGKGYLIQAWDPSVGPVVQYPDEPPSEPGGEPITGGKRAEGDLISRASSPTEVAMDLDRDEGDHDWFVWRRPRNRYDAVATYAPKGSGKDELRDCLLNCDPDFLEDAMGRKIAFGLRKKDREKSDIVWEYHMMHRRTPAMPEGRYTIAVAGQHQVFDGPLPYDDLGVSEMVPEEFLEVGSVGYASAWDLIGMQDAYDALMSAGITNFDAFGHNDMLIPSGVELSVEEIHGGLNAIRYPAGEFNKPSMLEKFSLKEEFFKLKDWMKGDMELVSGANSVARGEPEASLKSGTALALVQAQALHFQSGFMAAWTQLIEDSGTKTIKILKRYCKTPRLAAIAGANDPDGLVAFKGSDLDQIDRVEVEQVNPVFKTLAGKFDVANNLLERGLITDPYQYFEVLETGRLEPVVDPQRQEDLFYATIRETLMKGPKVEPKKGPDGLPELDELGQPAMHVPDLPVMITDNPVTCLQAAKSVLLSAENRKNMAVVQATTTYITLVLKTWRAAPADLLQLYGYPLPPPPPGSFEEQAAQQQAPDKGAPPGKEKAPPGKTAPNGKGEQANQQAPDQGSGMPSLPKPAKPPGTP